MQRLARLAIVSLTCSSCFHAPHVGPELRGEEALAVDYRTPTPEVIEAPETWSAGHAGLSAGVTELLAKLDHERARGFEGLDEVRQRSKLYRVPGPRDSLCYFYLQRQHAHDAGCIHVFLEDPASGSLSPRPIRYGSTWAAHDAPEPRFVDLDGDGVEELVTEDFFHNGTLLNLWVDTFWQVGQDLSLRPVLELAKQDAGIRIEEGAWGTTRRRLVRAAGSPGPRSLLVEVHWEPSEAGRPSTLLGTVALRREPRTGVWQEAWIEHRPMSAAWTEQVAGTDPRPPRP